MDLRLVSANKQFIESIRSIINKHCLNSASDVGQIRPHRVNYFELRYIDKVIWFYDSNHVKDGIIMNQKYNRYLLMKQLFADNKLSVKERTAIMIPFICKRTNRNKLMCYKN